MPTPRPALAHVAAMIVVFFTVVVGCDDTTGAATAVAVAPTVTQIRQASMPASARERVKVPPPPVPTRRDRIKLLDARRMVWDDAHFEDAQVGDELRYRNLLYRLTTHGLEYVDVASDEALANADASWDEDAQHSHPDGRDFVYVLGGPPDGGHRRLRYLQPGQRFAFQGRVFEVGAIGSQMTVKPTGLVVTAVTDTYQRQAPGVIDATVEYGDGTQDVLTATPEHPFWVPAVHDYVALKALEIGTTLHVQGGGEAILVSKTWRQGDFEVYDIEVEGLHNFFVRGPGSDAPGVLVHNSTRKSGVPDGTFEAHPDAGPYKRPSGAGPTAEQRASVQGQPCVDCGATTPRQVADHKDPLVVQHYRDGKVDVDAQRQVDAVQPHCPTCSAQQGGQLGGFGKKMKKQVQERDAGQ